MPSPLLNASSSSSFPLPLRYGVCPHNNVPVAFRELLATNAFIVILLHDGTTIENSLSRVGNINVPWQLKVSGILDIISNS